MSYVDKHLLPGERVMYRTKLHWRVFIGPLLLALVLTVAGVFLMSRAQSNQGLYIAAILLVDLIILFAPWLHRRSSEFAVTNKRVVIKLGVFSIRSIELLLQKIEGIEVQQSFMGRILGFGEILVKGTGGTQEAFDGIQSPLDFRQAVQAATDGSSGSALLDTADMGGSIHVIPPRHPNRGRTSMSARKVTRRDFVAGAGTAALSAMIVPRHVLGRGYQAPSDTLNIAIVGCGGQGMSNWGSLTSQNIVALCDVDFGYVERQLYGRLYPKDRQGNPTAPNATSTALGESYAKAKRYADFREMLDKQKDVEALVVATPDHAHAIIAKTAMQARKHVYVQKPLTHSVYEARKLAEIAKATGVTTQMGNQGHSTDDARLINEWIAAGLIGPVREVHVYTDRPIGYWPQGIPRPAHRIPAPPASPSAPSTIAAGPPPPVAPVGAPTWNMNTVNNMIAEGLWAANYTPPDTLNWDLYTAPCAHDVAYHPIYHPFTWRGWTDFGCGALGDMGAHLIDHPFWALGLDRPISIEATSTPWGGGARNPATFPAASTVHYEFAARGNQPAVRLFWYDGGLYPPRPQWLPDSVNLPSEGGVFILGEKGMLWHQTYGSKPQLFPAELMQKAASVPKTMERITVSHEMNWAQACKGVGKATCPFEYASRLTETMLLGLVALRSGQGKKILYDAVNMNVTNNPDSNQYLKPGYRPGWEV